MWTLWDVPGMWGICGVWSEGGRVRGFRGEFATVCAVVWGRWHAVRGGFGRCFRVLERGFWGVVGRLGSLWVVDTPGRSVGSEKMKLGQVGTPPAGRGGARRQGAGLGTWAGRREGRRCAHAAGAPPSRPPCWLVCVVSNRAGSGCDSSGSSRSRLLSSTGGRSRAPGSARCRSAGEPGPRGWGPE